MDRRSVRWWAVVALALSAAHSLSSRSLHAQWEDWLGGWLIAAFGACGAAGCASGQYLCAVVDDGSGPAYCYER